MAGFTKHNEKSADFAKGGKTKMFGPQGADDQAPGTTSPDNGPDKDKFAKGGSGKMFGYAGVQAAEAGKTSAR